MDEGLSLRILRFEIDSNRIGIFLEIELIDEGIIINSIEIKKNSNGFEIILPDFYSPDLDKPKSCVRFAKYETWLAFKKAVNREVENSSWVKHYFECNKLEDFTPYPGG